VGVWVGYSYIHTYKDRIKQKSRQGFLVIPTVIVGFLSAYTYGVGMRQSVLL